MIVLILTIVVSSATYLIGEQNGARSQKQIDEVSASLVTPGIIWCDPVDQDFQ